MKNHCCQFYLTIPLNYEIICTRIYRQILSIEAQMVSKNIKKIFNICVLQHKEVVDEVFCVFTIPIFILFRRGFMMTIRKFSIFMITFAFIALVVGLTGCEKAMEMMPEVEMPGITIGVALAESGEYAEPYGFPMLRGLQLAQEQLNMQGANIMFVHEDNMSTKEGSIAAVQALVDKGVPAIIGVGISSQLIDAFPIAQEAGVVAFSPISSAAGYSGLVGDYAFRAGIATNILAPGGVKKTLDALEYKNVAIIFDAIDDYSISVKDELTEALGDNGVIIQHTAKFETHDVEFSTQLDEIMNLDPQPDALFIAALSADMILIMKEIGRLGINTQLIVPDLTNAEVTAVGDAAEGAYAFAGWSSKSETPGNQEFVQAYMAKYEGRAPEPWAAQAYATLNILANAIKTAGSTDSVAIRDALAQTKSLPTILGPFSFDSMGEAIYEDIEAIVQKVENGVLVDQ